VPDTQEFPSSISTRKHWAKDRQKNKGIHDLAGIEGGNHTNGTFTGKRVQKNGLFLLDVAKHPGKKKDKRAIGSSPKEGGKEPGVHLSS